MGYVCPFIDRPLDSPKQAVTVEEIRSPPPSLMRAVVRGEDYHSILRKPLLLQQVQDIAHLLVKARYHAGELCVRCGGRIVPRPSSPPYNFSSNPFSLSWYISSIESRGCISSAWGSVYVNIPGKDALATGCQATQWAFLCIMSAEYCLRFR